MQRTRDYYVALGYGNPYRWAHFDEVPFTPLRTPLNRARVALITTAAPYQPEAGNQEPGAPYNAAAKFYQVYSIPSESVPDLRISHVGYDRKHSSAADIHAGSRISRVPPTSRAADVRFVVHANFGRLAAVRRELVDRRIHRVGWEHLPGV